ncbi:ComEA family DNA-binding protein [Demequina sp. NBRC 110053]|uniref:ComEA family DNA-binding protein n=1 Tax=Demequina sp. NBRC 110053 TaxID=1570342 RepID=UPI0013564259|nr:ComEA family DNA-binding protein [Demequina sp. NBRC 110053]
MDTSPHRDAASSHPGATSDGERDEGLAHWRESAARAATRAYEAAYGREIPDEAQGVRWRLGGRATAAACLAILVAGIVGWWLTQRVWAEVPQGTESQIEASVLATAASSASPVEGLASVVGGGAEAPDAVLVLQVSGAVAAPGLVEVAAGSRVADAVEAAGGLTADADLGAVNLAREAVDGEHVRVLAMGEASEADGLVRLNSAGPSELEALPGVGPVLAQRIAADRDANGPFASLDDVQRVSGVGPALVAGWEGVAEL